MITTNLQGRMGNQMFQIAACVALALDNDVKYSIPSKTTSPQTWEKYEFFNPIPEYSFEIKSEYTQKNFEYEPIPFQDGMRLTGYFQSEKFFAHRRKEILELFGFTPALKKGVVGVHVRRGDYLEHSDSFPVCTEDYYIDAMKYFADRGYKKFLIHTDDLPWCMGFFRRPAFSDYEVEFTPFPFPLKDMESMSQCEHNIIANSSFSWWGAWLNTNPDKIVLAPYRWFGQKVNFKTIDILPDSWIKI